MDLDEALVVYKKHTTSLNFSEPQKCVGGKSLP